MLALSPFPGEGITIIDTRTGEKGMLTIVSVSSSNRVKLAFDFPGHYLIVRDEIADREPSSATVVKASTEAAIRRD